DPQQQTAPLFLAVLIDGEAIAAPAFRRFHGALPVAMLAMQQAADAELADNALAGLTVSRQLRREVRKTDDDRVVPMGVPLLGMQDLLGRAGRIGLEGVVEELLAAAAPGAHA